MRRFLTSAIAAAGLAALASVASAQTPVCDSYSSACPSATSTSIAPTVQPTRLTRPDPGTLPLTGGQLVGLVVVGGGAVAAGVAFVTASRRKGAHAG